MAQIKQRDLFVRRWSIYRVRIWRKDFEVDFKVDFEFGFTSRPMHVRKYKTVLVSGFHAVDFRIPVRDSSFFLLELGFRIPVVCGIPDSLSWIPDSKTQNSVLHKRHFPDSGFRKQNFPAQHGVIRVIRIMLPK